MVSMGLLKKLSAASGLYFGVFLVLHLVSHYSLLFGLERAMKNMTLFRKVYQNPIFELGLIVALMVHYASNTMIYMHRTKIEAKSTKLKKNDDLAAKPTPSIKGEWELKGHRYSGYFLSLAVLGHVSATRIAPFLFYSIQHSLTTRSQRMRRRKYLVPSLVCT
jgi:hypothetical protein